MKKYLNWIVYIFFAINITFRRMRTFATLQKPKTEMYTLNGEAKDPILELSCEQQTE